MEFDPDRPRGVLSTADRRYLLGITDMDHEQSRRNAEARIRERIANGVEDFYLVARRLKQKDRRQIFDKNLDETPFRYGLVGMLTFAYMGSKESGMDFEHLLEPATRRAEEVYVAERLNSTVDVDVTFGVDVEAGATLETVADRIREGEAVTPGEFFSVMSGKTRILGDVESIDLQLGVADLALEEETFVARVAEFMDGDLEWLADDRVRVHLGPEAGFDDSVENSSSA
ncbi:MAG: hypothetical protein ACI9PP_000599 [Halobacteriales archaeon]|jgi:hypothetical protein